MIGILGMFVGVLLSNHWALAQTPQKTTLQLLKSATGEITNVQPEQRWTFDAGKGQRVSARMQATSGDLDPYLELLDSSGKLLTAGVTASLRNVAIDGFPIPETATYTLRATRAQSGGTPSSGQYSLTLLPGFSFLLLNDPTGVTAAMRTFRDVNSYSRLVDGKLGLPLTAANAYTLSTAAATAGIFHDL